MKLNKWIVNECGTSTEPHASYDALLEWINEWMN